MALVWAVKTHRAKELMVDASVMTENLTTADERAAEQHPTSQLILRAQQGDLHAFDRIIIMHQKRVVSVAWRMLGNREDAMDACQEVFIKAYRNLGRIDPDRDFSGWLYRITINVCHDQARSRNRRRQLSLEEAIEAGNIPEPASHHDTETSAILRQEQAIVSLALATLTEKERAAIVLRDLEGLSSDEVAVILGSSPATVRSQISSARSKIRLFRERLQKKGASKK